MTSVLNQGHTALLAWLASRLGAELEQVLFLTCCGSWSRRPFHLTLFFFFSLVIIPFAGAWRWEQARTWPHHHCYQGTNNNISPQAVCFINTDNMIQCLDPLPSPHIDYAHIVWGLSCNCFVVCLIDIVHTILPTQTTILNEKSYICLGIKTNKRQPLKEETLNEFDKCSNLGSNRQSPLLL